jgi:dTMP kinase
MARGRLVVVEGIDGSGLTTQAQALVGWLTAQGERARLTKEPTSGPVGSLIRQALNRRLQLSERTLALLFAADRLDHLEHEVLPALRQGVHVVTDRYYLSSLAYQSLRVDTEWLIELNAACVRPDLHLFLDVPVDEALGRVHRRGNGVEVYEQAEVLAEVRANYLTLLDRLREFGERIVTVDGAAPAATVTTHVTAAVAELLALPPSELLPLGELLRERGA